MTKRIAAYRLTTVLAQSLELTHEILPRKHPTPQPCGHQEARVFETTAKLQASLGTGLL